MSRFWIGLAMVLWLGAYAAAADKPSQVPQGFPPAVTATAAATVDPAPVPVIENPSGKSRGPATTLVPPEMPFRSAPGASRERWSTHVWRLRNAPALQIAQAINTVLSNAHLAGRADVLTRAVIVPEVVSNSLVVAGPTEALDELRKLVDGLDHAPVMIRLEVVMGDVPTASVPTEAGAKADRKKIHASVVDVEEARKKMEVLFHAQLTTLDNQPAHLQAGRREPTIAGINSTPMGQMNSVMPQNLGTILTVTPRANADSVVTMQLNIEDSRFAPPSEGVPIFVPSKGEPVRSPITETLEVQATIKVADGQTVLLSDFSRKPKDGKQRVILVTVHVSPIGDQTKHER